MHFFCYKLYFYGVACEQLIWYGRHIKLPNKCLPNNNNEKDVHEAQYHQKDILKTTTTKTEKKHSLYNFMYLLANV